MPDTRAIQQYDVDLLGGEIEGGQQTYDTAADNDYFLLGHLGLGTRENGFSDPSSLWW